MKQARQETKSTIRFSGKLIGKTGSFILTLPKGASSKLPSRGTITVEATINGFPFRAPLEPDGKGSYKLTVNKAMQEAADAQAGDTVAVEITRVGEEPEIRVPADLQKAISTVPKAQATWTDITPMARREWILWLGSTKYEETRKTHVKKAISMLSSGKRRICCFGGISWLRKDYPKAGETWEKLPNPLLQQNK